MAFPWIKNTDGKPDSQLTLQTGWNILGMALVFFVVIRNTMAGLPVGDEVWWFVGAMAGIKTGGYVSRRGFGGASRSRRTQEEGPPDRHRVST